MKLGTCLCDVVKRANISSIAYDRGPVIITQRGTVIEAISEKQKMAVFFEHIDVTELLLDAGVLEITIGLIQERHADCERSREMKILRDIIKTELDNGI